MNPVEKLRNARPVILPSMLQNDFSDIAGVCSRLQEAGVSGLHLDVMDGCFVPNISYGLPIVAAFRKSTDLVLDCHLMIERPEKYVRQFAEAGADLVTFHVEATDDPQRCVEEIRQAGASVGVALNPGTPLEAIEPLTRQCDLVLVMSVHAGFGGQSFIENSLQRLEQARQLEGDFLLEVDGGINGSTIQQCAAAGAELFVVGSAIFGQEDYAAAIAEMAELAGAKNENA
ncbi:MAG: ribulose-phosphate 3-epimerase [Planctomycetota bacterium]|nr:ribulose-phosphate 3-epimerase [Planctomycetota bacterium]